MWNHAIVMEDMLAEKDLAWPRFSGNEMRDLVSYVQDASTRSKAEKKKRGIVPLKSKVLFLSENRFDIEVARLGKKIYTAKACNACHDITGKKRTMGGDLKNITKMRDLEWLFNFIKDPKSMLKTDGLAKQLLREYNNIPMPQQGLTDEEVIAILEYLKAPEKIK
jgi:cytochrome c1